MKIKKGDTVKIIAGKDKGKTGAVKETFRQDDTVIVEGVNIATKHQGNRRRRSQGQIVKVEMPIHVSNVALMAGDKPVRIGYKLEGTGDEKKKVRVARPSGKAV